MTPLRLLTLSSNERFLQAADVLRDYQAFQIYERNGLAAVLHFATGAGMPEETVSWAYELCKANMEEMYR